MVRPRSYARVARPIPHARRSHISASLSAPPVIRGGPAGRSWSIPQGGGNNSTGGRGGTMATDKDATPRVWRASVEGQALPGWQGRRTAEQRAQQRAYPSPWSTAKRPV